MRLSEEEISRGKLSNKRQIAIQSSGLAAAMPMANKEWFPDRFQTVVTALRERYAFVQLGSATDPALDGAIDLRGRTSLREAAAIIARSDLFVGLVGLLMHVARSVDTRAVIVYGGRERAWQSGYTCNVNIESDIDCSPCWRIASCPHDRQCMRDIQVEAVVAAIRSQASLIGQPICDDADVI